MPITLVVPVTGLFGPGSQVIGGTNLIGPIPIDYFWRVSLTTSTGEVSTMYQEVVTGGSRNLSLVWLDPSIPIIPRDQQALKDGDQARVLVQLMDGSGVEKESISVGVTYDSTVGLPIIQQMQAQPGQGGLTEEQAQQLADVDTASSFARLTDALTLTELTSGPTGDPVVAPLASVTFGVIVRLTTIPEGLFPQTPDGQYWTKTLAVVRVFRGNDLWIRAPIHTPTKIVAFEKEGLTVWVTNLTLTQWLLNMRVLVDWLPGVTGRVYQMHFP